jgi:hypothetical protein
MRLTELASRHLFAVAIVLAATSIGTNHKARADEPRLAFDFGRTLECRDVTPPDFAEAYPDERIVECTLRLSVSLAGGSMDDIQSLRVEIADRDRRLKVFDFSPWTQMESTLAKDIKWTKSVERSHEFGASLGGELPTVIGGAVAHVTPTINGTKGNKETVTETQVRYAPQQVVVASGTIDQEHGVFFTLRQSPLSSLEGVHELTVAFVVPSHWRGDAVQVSCVATGTQKMLWMKQQKVWAEQAGGVALYLAGDGEARRAAERRMRQ